MSDDVTSWLEQLDLGEYADAFVANAIDSEVLVELSEADLEKIGVKLGHRKKLLKAIAALESHAPPAAQSAAGADDAAPSDESLAAWERHPGERKPVTMLFADVTGSTALTEKLDAEETHELLYGATQAMCQAVEENRGTVCRFMGDGVMAMFGAPVASEQHAVDACKAAFEMQQAVSEYAAVIASRYGADLRIRVGLHSGEVVVLTVGDGDKIEYDASGPVVPIAARMEQSAKPGEIYLTAATQSLAGGRIECEALAPVSVKGISEPLPVFALRRLRSAEEARHSESTTPFVGRRADVVQFQSMLESCIDEGLGQTVYVRGEPGIGKTRLVEEFARIAADKGATIHRGLVLPFGVGKGQSAIRSLVRNLLGVSMEGRAEERERAAAKALAEGRVDADRATFLNDLLDLPQPMELRALYDAMDNAVRNAGRRALVSQLVTAASRERPVLVIVEDVHWADALTLAHLASLAAAVAECRALLVMTSRIEGDQLDREWRSATRDSPFVTIDLGPLRKQDAMALIAGFMDADDPMAAGCLQRAAGNPLFLEQLLRTAREGSSMSLPDSIQSLVLARLDRLAPADKRALQAAAVIGQRFAADLLAHLVGAADYDCNALLDHNLIRHEGDGYLFSHALIQEGVYGSLLKSQRRALHAKAAAWYADSDAVLHAEHLASAEDPGAPKAFLAAARDEARQFRFDRALDLCRRGLTLTEEQSDRHELTCLEGALLRDVADVPASMAAYRRALEHAVDDSQRFDAWMGVAAGMRVMTEYLPALDLLAKAEKVVPEKQSAVRLSELHHLRGNLYFSLARVDECRTEHTLALQHAEQCGSAEGEARALGGLGDAEYARGRMLTAKDYYTRCIEIARAHGFGRTEVAHLGQRGFTRLYAGDWSGAESDALAAIEIATKVGDRRAEMNATQCICEVSFDKGECERLEYRSAQALEITRSLGARAWETLAMSWQAIVLHWQGQQARASELIQEAVAITRESGRAFNLGRMVGILAYVMAEDDVVREQALREGEQALRENSLSHNYFWFNRFAMDAMLSIRDWDRVEAYAAALEEVTREQPLAQTDYHAARGRALAAFGRGKRDDATIVELERLRDLARRHGVGSALPGLEKALAQL